MKIQNHNKTLTGLWVFHLKRNLHTQNYETNGNIEFLLISAVLCLDESIVVFHTALSRYALLNVSQRVANDLNAK
jgi:hypothetical protein